MSISEREFSSGDGDRRRISRVPLQVPIRIKILQNAAAYDGITQNASADGIFLFVNKVIPEGSYVELFFDLRTEDGRALDLWFSGKVVRVEPGTAPEMYGMAVAATNRSIKYR